ncbi:MAG: phosphoribosylformylglycinamidine cyclo-ligase [Candidatus Omnitrophota bacterium]|nr:phosphoribosylformylglycinamidine cyclo-ligase [Candidatus Omnitrophota bacterium]MDZ4241914.1 phosphoribosylformylglycinamidine cyclo-ligase [Candidatus Omnitrophota bacterium]
MKKRATYKTSGVDIGKAEVFVKAIGPMVKSTFVPAVLNRTTAFGSLFALDKSAYQEPVLVSSTDGVGTKLLVAKTIGRHDTVGIDLVAMNVNDVLCVGAKPLFFLDYIACGKLEPKVLQDVMKGIIEGCRQAGCSLIGGETAEMPGMYKREDYDLAGFAVGVVDKSRIIDGSSIETGDQVIGLASTGLHSNGYSLARKVFSPKEQKALGKELLAPTRIYVKEVLAVLEKFTVKGLAHVTGGAFYEKMTKILQPGKCFLIDKNSWPVPKIFQKIQKKGRIDTSEMFRTFNMGIGMILVVKPEDAVPVRSYLNGLGAVSYRIGEVVDDPKRKIIFGG